LIKLIVKMHLKDVALAVKGILISLFRRPM
jgi:hypothetical protein